MFGCQWGWRAPRRRCCIVGAPGARPRRARAALPGPRGPDGTARCRRARAAVALGCTANRKRYNRRRVGPVVACSGNVLVSIGARIGMYSERIGRRIGARMGMYWWVPGHHTCTIHTNTYHNTYQYVRSVLVCIIRTQYRLNTFLNTYPIHTIIHTNTYAPYWYVLYVHNTCQIRAQYMLNTSLIHAMIHTWYF